MLVTAGLNDPRVSYWEPAKWVRRLRRRRPTTDPLLLKTEMGAGHRARRVATTPGGTRPSCSPSSSTRSASRPRASAERREEQRVVGQAPRRPQEAERAHVLEPVGERRAPGERAAAEHPGEARAGPVSASSATASLARSAACRATSGSPASTARRRALVGLHGQPVVLLGPRPLDLLVGAQLVGLAPRAGRGRRATASSSTPRTTAVNRVAMNGAGRPGDRRRVGPSQASRTAGAPVEAHGVALGGGHAHAVPLGDQLAARRVPSHGRSRTSSTKIVGSSSPSGDGRRDHAVGDARAAAEVLVAGDAVRRPGEERLSPSMGVGHRPGPAMSPPLPGSEVIVPHCSPASGAGEHGLAAAPPSAAGPASGLASQKPMTAGCIADTSATDGSAPARWR